MAQDPEVPRSAEPNGEDKIQIKIGKNATVCRVCGKPGHQVGFRGAVYIDCPNKPCYLCKKDGHTTTTCPYRARKRVRTPTLDQPQLKSLVERQWSGSPLPATWGHVLRDACIFESAPKLHSRRVTALAFSPTHPHLLVSGSKFGELAVWNFARSGETSVLPTHEYLISGMAFDRSMGNAMYTTSQDGTVRHIDLETNCVQTLLNANPNGWVASSSWRMMLALESSPDWGFVLAGDDIGRVHMIDPRSPAVPRVAQLHRKDKVTCLSANPRLPHLLLSTSNDHTMRLWDVRKLDTTGGALATVNHPRLVTSAYFSPRTGSRIVSTCTDNRIRVWDSVYGDLLTPSRDIVHSQDFSRYISPFRAVWDPKDPYERVLYCGRFISEDVAGRALHPIDVLDASTGALLGALSDPSVTTISPVLCPHPHLDLLAAGSSSSVYMWRPKAFAPKQTDPCGPSAREAASRASIRSAGSAADVADGLHSLAAGAGAARAASKKRKPRTVTPRKRGGKTASKGTPRAKQQSRNGAGADDESTFQGAGAAAAASAVPAASAAPARKRGRKAGAGAAAASAGSGAASASTGAAVPPGLRLRAKVVDEAPASRAASPHEGGKGEARSSDKGAPLKRAPKGPRGKRASQSSSRGSASSQSSFSPSSGDDSGSDFA